MWGRPPLSLSFPSLFVIAFSKEVWEGNIWSVEKGKAFGTLFLSGISTLGDRQCGETDVMVKGEESVQGGGRYYRVDIDKEWQLFNQVYVQGIRIKTLHFFPYEEYLE